MTYSYYRRAEQIVRHSKVAGGLLEPYSVCGWFRVIRMMCDHCPYHVPKIEYRCVERYYTTLYRIIL